MRIQDLEKARIDGMCFALKIAKEKGVEGLEEEIAFRNISQAPIGLDMKYVNMFIDRMKHMMYGLIKVIALITLHDEFGFGNKRCMQFYERFQQKADGIMEGYATLYDYAETIQDEMGIDVSDITADNFNEHFKIADSVKRFD